MMQDLLNIKYGDTSAVLSKIHYELLKQSFL